MLFEDMPAGDDMGGAATDDTNKDGMGEEGETMEKDGEGSSDTM